MQPDKGSDSRVKLNDLAQVIPKGRTVQIIVGEKDVSLHRLCCGRPLTLRTAREAGVIRNTRQ